MVIRSYDLIKKWMASSEIVEEVLDRMVVEQVVSTMSTDLQIWVTEQKPESREVADSYIQAQLNEGGRNDGSKKTAGPKLRDYTQQGTGDGNRAEARRGTRQSTVPTTLRSKLQKGAIKRTPRAHQLSRWRQG